MITANPHGYDKKANVSSDCSLGNVLFTIAGVIGSAVKNGYGYGFKKWPNQEYFVNPLPGIEKIAFKAYKIPPNYKGFDVGFRGFNIPNNVNVNGYFGSRRYFEHCENLIRYYFTMKDVFTPIKDCIIIHYRNYSASQRLTMASLDETYYKKALSSMPKKKVVVVTDNVDMAFKTIRLKCEYISTSPIKDFYLLAHADYLIGSNSTFSWWGAWLSGAETVVPSRYFEGSFKDCPVNLREFYCDNWRMV
jgi:hypothetical protein